MDEFSLAGHTNQEISASVMVADAYAAGFWMYDGGIDVNMSTNIPDFNPVAENLLLG
ncbi:MAG: hypothetical protein U9N81_05815 [Bacillota bacterium]|nr:hypothetical protein [Bacillota bacterium]